MEALPRMNRDDLRHFFQKWTCNCCIYLWKCCLASLSLVFAKSGTDIYPPMHARVNCVTPSIASASYKYMQPWYNWSFFTNLFLTATAGVSNMERGNSRQIFAKCRSKSNSKKIIRDRAHELQICHEDRWQSLFLSLNRCKAVGSYYIREPSFT